MRDRGCLSRLWAALLGLGAALGINGEGQRRAAVRASLGGEGVVVRIGTMVVRRLKGLLLRGEGPGRSRSVVDTEGAGIGAVAARRLKGLLLGGEGEVVVKGEEVMIKGETYLVPATGSPHEAIVPVGEDSLASSTSNISF